MDTRRSQIHTHFCQTFCLAAWKTMILFTINNICYTKNNLIWVLLVLINDFCCCLINRDGLVVSEDYSQHAWCTLNSIRSKLLLAHYSHFMLKRGSPSDDGNGWRVRFRCSDMLVIAKNQISCCVAYRIKGARCVCWQR